MRRSLCLAALLLFGCTQASSPVAGGTASTDATATATAAKSAAPRPPPVKRRVEYIETGDLPKLEARGVLRVLVHGIGEQFLPRAEMPFANDRAMAMELGEHLGLDVQFILVEAFDQLIPTLLAGKGDLIAAQMTITADRQEKVAFTRPTLGVKEILVGRKGQANLPSTLDELKGHKVHVRASSSYAKTLKKLEVEVVPVPESMDAEAIVYEVTRGKRPLTAVDSHLLKAIGTYNPDTLPLFPIANDREIAWAVRKENPKLRAAADAVIIESALTGHTDEVFAGDLAGIKKRGAIRVLTRNNPISYFLYRGRQFGFEYELAKMIADELGVRLEVVVPPSHDQLIPWLLAGKGDFIAASMTVTARRAKRVAFTKRYFEVDQMVVQKIGGMKWTSIADLAGKTVHVRKSSSYYSSLVDLRTTIGAFEIVEVPEDVDTATILDWVGEGKLPLTIADEHFVGMMTTFDTPIEAVAVVARPSATPPDKRNIAFAVRPSSAALKAHLDGWVTRNYRGLNYNVAKKRYFENKKTIIQGQERSAETGQLSPYDAVIKKYASKYGFDWRLMAAQAYAESRFDPKAKSWVGARGLFQVMPRTGRALGFTNLEDPEQGVQAGIKYMNRLMKRFDPSIPFRQRVRFSLAAYNAGLGHVMDARRLAAEMGLNPDRWFHNVEKAMLLLQEPQYAKRARHGYCRGTEPVKYVSRIQSYYDAYVNIVGP